ncbi:MAG TPA: leucine-rich repeat domain-containing protein [Verrucomicrobiae bacterium]|jgi:hypothetical protein
MQRIIVCIVLNCLLVLSARAQFGYATNPGGTTVTITSYSGPLDVIIPSTINGLAVTSIGDNAFGNDGITSVWIPYGVTNIGHSAFNSSLNLTNIEIPDSVTTIGDSAFLGAGLTSLIVPSSVTNMGDAAFGGLGDLTNLTLEYGISDIQSGSFSGFALTSVTIPSSVTNIGSGAFSPCDYLTSIFFKGNAPTVDSTVFRSWAFFGLRNPVVSNYYSATAYYLPGTTGWSEFSSNTLMAAMEGSPTNEFIPTVLWSPTIQVAGTNFGVQNGQYGFDVTATTNLPIAIEACDDLTQSNWVVLQRLTLTNGLYHFSEPFLSNSMSRFYRIGFP